MTIRAIFRLFLCLFLCVASTLAMAQQERMEAATAQVASQLAKYEKAVVEAARRHVVASGINKQFQTLVERRLERVVRQARQLNPALQEADFKDFEATFRQGSLGRHDGFIVDWLAANMLAVYTQEEVLALDRFFTSDIGKSILSKNQKTMVRFPELLTVVNGPIVLSGMAAAQAKLAASGKTIEVGNW